MTTAIIGTGNIGSRLARDLTSGGEPLAIAGQDAAKARSLTEELGSTATSDSVRNAIAGADAVIFAVWLDTTLELLERHAGVLPGKIIIDPSNPITADSNGGFERTLPEGESSGKLIAARLPASAHFVKAFGTLGAESLKADANREPERAVLFYATDDPIAQPVAERLINTAGFTPLRAGGVHASLRIEVGGDLHQFGGLDGRTVTLAQARAALTAAT
ncbi:NADPH-dependent F420 reductase [Streptomyces sp. SM11]|uniref:NADPH-dependent F420 reductase n=1 Tax=Streptomyces sp. SM11 TaxID=565557 RepID=UPI000CD529CF|nr:NAD(P)-binding domain-containing protein [Streptomyces sp. SM11]